MNGVLKTHFMLVKQCQLPIYEHFNSKMTAWAWFIMIPKFTTVFYVPRELKDSWRNCFTFVAENSALSASVNNDNVI